MSQQKWMKWVVGLAGVVSFSTFVGVLNHENGAIKEGASFEPLQDEALSLDDQIEAEWLYHDHGHGDDYDDEDHEEDDDHDDDDYYDRRVINWTSTDRPTTRTRAS